MADDGSLPLFAWNAYAPETLRTKNHDETSTSTVHSNIDTSHSIFNQNVTNARSAVHGWQVDSQRCPNITLLRGGNGPQQRRCYGAIIHL